MQDDFDRPKKPILTVARVTAFTHRGRVRESNEDTIVVGSWVSAVDMSGPEQTEQELAAPLVCAVADGMGGHQAGEVASRYVARRVAGMPEQFTEPRSAAEALHSIDGELYQAMAADENLHG